MSVATNSETYVAPDVRQTQILIGDEWRSAVSGKTFQTINPATEEVISEVAEGDKEDVDRAMDFIGKQVEKTLPKDWSLEKEFRHLSLYRNLREQD